MTINCNNNSCFIYCFNSTFNTTNSCNSLTRLNVINQLTMLFRTFCCGLIIKKYITAKLRLYILVMKIAFYTLLLLKSFGFSTFNPYCSKNSSLKSKDDLLEWLVLYLPLILAENVNYE